MVLPEQAVAVVLPASVLFSLPPTLAEHVFGDTVLSACGFRPSDPMLPAASCFFSALVFRFACLHPRHCKHPFVKKVYSSAGYPEDRKELSLVDARKGRYDTACHWLHGSTPCTEACLSGIFDVMKRAIREMGLFYTVTIALAVIRRRRPRAAPLARDYAKSILFYTGAFSTIRALNCSASALCRQIPADLPGLAGLQPFLIRWVLPFWFSLCMGWVAVESKPRQRQIAKFTAVAALTSALRAADASPPPAMMVAATTALSFSRSSRTAASLLAALGPRATRPQRAATAACLCALAAGGAAAVHRQREARRRRRSKTEPAGQGAAAAAPV